jgi:hypothetical protein
VLSIKRAACLALFALVAGQAQNITNRTIFVGREPLTPADKSAFLNLFTTRIGALNIAPRSLFVFPTMDVLLTSPFDSSIDLIYGDVTPQKSLLINDCNGFCEDPFFSFGRIVGQAARSTAMSQPDTAHKAWYDSLASVVPHYQDHVKSWTGSPADQFQLLAVVNRLDFAAPTGNNQWGGAELRFVYGARMPIPHLSPEPFSAIVEFVLPDLSWKDFRTLAGAWHDLRKLQGAAFAAQLKTLLGQPWSPVADEPSSCSRVRIRTNSMAGGGSAPWFLAQWELSQGKLQQAPLTDEIFRQCTRSDGKNPYKQQGCPQAPPASCRDYRPMYNQFAAHPGLTMGVESSQLLAKTQCYFAADPGMDGPSGVCATDQAAGPEGLMALARNVLSLQQCSNCHGAETNNSAFFQVANRLPKETLAQLSPFLVGGGPKPSQDDLNNHRDNAVFTAHVSVTWPGSGNCRASTVTVDRYFNDLARRGLYLAAVLVNDSSTPPNPQLTQIIRGFGPNMTH